MANVFTYQTNIRKVIILSKFQNFPPTTSSSQNTHSYPSPNLHPTPSPKAHSTTLSWQNAAALTHARRVMRETEGRGIMWYKIAFFDEGEEFDQKSLSMILSREHKSRNLIENEGDNQTNKMISQDPRINQPGSQDHFQRKHQKNMINEIEK